VKTARVISDPLLSHLRREEGELSNLWRKGKTAAGFSGEASLESSILRKTWGASGGKREGILGPGRRFKRRRRRWDQRQHLVTCDVCK